MKSSTAVFVFIVGLLMTFGAVGGIEVSVSNSDLMSSMVVAIVGLLTMYCGMLGLKGADYYDAQ
jgi:fumarate reductase subunit D